MLRSLYPQADTRSFTWNDNCSMAEIWRQVPGFGDFYEVSSEGRIRRDGRVHRVRHTPDGYYQAALTVNGNATYVSVHRLVAQAFLPPGRSDQTQVNHINGIKDDNHVSNLEWASPGENLRHANRTGLRNPCHGERVNTAKLSRNDVQEIRLLKGSGCSSARVAAIYCVSDAQIRFIWSGKGWQRLPWPTEARRAS